MIENNELVEWNEVHGNYYGTPKSFVEKTLAEGNRVLFDLDVFGKVNFDKVYPDATGILILPLKIAVQLHRPQAPMLGVRYPLPVLPVQSC